MAKMQLMCKNHKCIHNNRSKCSLNVIIVNEDGMCHIESSRRFQIALSEKQIHEYEDNKCSRNVVKKISNYVVRSLIKKEIVS